MVSLNRTLAAAAVMAGLMGVASVPAHAVTVNGVTFDIGANLAVNSFYQNAPQNVGDTLTAVGRIDEINNNTGFCSGCELDFVATGFTVASNQGGNLGFTGGTVTLYVNAPGTLNTNAGSLGAIVTAVQGGSQWLNLAGHTFASGTSPTGNFTLTATVSQVGGLTSIFGNSLLDVVAGAGAANGFFNTNTFNDGLGGRADVAIGSHTDPQIACPTGVALCGSGDVRTVAVPEPASMAIFGASLLAFGFLRRRDQD